MRRPPDDDVELVEATKQLQKEDQEKK